jgi:hypothetical protein
VDHFCIDRVLSAAQSGDRTWPNRSAPLSAGTSMHSCRFSAPTRTVSAQAAKGKKVGKGGKGNSSSKSSSAILRQKEMLASLSNKTKDTDEHSASDTSSEADVTLVERGRAQVKEPKVIEGSLYDYPMYYDWCDYPQFMVIMISLYWKLNESRYCLIFVFDLLESFKYKALPGYKRMPRATCIQVLRLPGLRGRGMPHLLGLNYYIVQITKVYSATILLLSHGRQLPARRWKGIEI